MSRIEKKEKTSEQNFQAWAEKPNEVTFDQFESVLSTSEGRRELVQLIESLVAQKENESQLAGQLASSFAQPVLRFFREVKDDDRFDATVLTSRHALLVSLLEELASQESPDNTGVSAQSGGEKAPEGHGVNGGEAGDGSLKPVTPDTQPTHPEEEPAKNTGELSPASPPVVDSKPAEGGEDEEGDSAGGVAEQPRPDTEPKEAPPKGSEHWAAGIQDMETFGLLKEYLGLERVEFREDVHDMFFNTEELIALVEEAEEGSVDDLWWENVPEGYGFKKKLHELVGKGTGVDGDDASGEQNVEDEEETVKVDKNEEPAQEDSKDDAQEDVSVGIEDAGNADALVAFLQEKHIEIKQGPKVFTTDDLVAFVEAAQSAETQKIAEAPRAHGFQSKLLQFVDEERRVRKRTRLEMAGARSEDLENKYREELEGYYKSLNEAGVVSRWGTLLKGVVGIRPELPKDLEQLDKETREARFTHKSRREMLAMERVREKFSSKEKQDKFLRRYERVLARHLVVENINERAALQRKLVLEMYPKNSIVRNALEQYRKHRNLRMGVTIGAYTVVGLSGGALAGLAAGGLRAAGFIGGAVGGGAAGSGMHKYLERTLVQEKRERVADADERAKQGLGSVRSIDQLRALENELMSTRRSLEKGQRVQKTASVAAAALGGAALGGFASDALGDGIPGESDIESSEPRIDVTDPRGDPEQAQASLSPDAGEVSEASPWAGEIDKREPVEIPIPSEESDELAPAPAVAEAVTPDESDSAAPAEAPEAQAPRVAEDSEGGTQEEEATAPVEAQSTIHEVQKGDTLWDLMDGDKGDRGMSPVLERIPEEHRNAALDLTIDRVGKSEDLMREVGIGSGDPNKILWDTDGKGTGEKVNLSVLDRELESVAKERGWVTDEGGALLQSDADANAGERVIAGRAETLESAAEPERVEGVSSDESEHAEEKSVPVHASEASPEPAEPTVAPDTEDPHDEPQQEEEEAPQQSPQRSGPGLYAGGEQVAAVAAAGVGTLGVASGQKQSGESSTVSEAAPSQTETQGGKNFAPKELNKEVEAIVSQVEKRQQQGVVARLFGENTRAYDKLKDVSLAEFIRIAKLADADEQNTALKKLDVDREVWEKWVSKVNDLNQKVLKAKREETLGTYLTRVAEANLSTNESLRLAA